MTFDFTSTLNEVEAFVPTAGRLPAGQHKVKLVEVDNVVSSGGYPMLKIKVENPEGVQWDNLVISPNEFSVQKLKGLIVAAGIKTPTAKEMDSGTGKLTDGYVRKLVGQYVGIVVRDEEDNRPEHRGEMRPRVQGYIPATDVEGALSVAGATDPGSAVTSDDDIPF